MTLGQGIAVCGVWCGVVGICFSPVGPIAGFIAVIGGAFATCVIASP